MSHLNSTRIRKVYALIERHDRNYPCLSCKNRTLDDKGRIDCLCDALYEFYATILREVTK